MRSISIEDQVKHLKGSKCKTKKVWKQREGKTCRLLLFCATVYSWFSQVKDDCPLWTCSTLVQLPDSVLIYLPLPPEKKKLKIKLLTVKRNSCEDLNPAELQDPILKNGNRDHMYKTWQKSHGRETKETLSNQKTLTVSMKKDYVTGRGIKTSFSLTGKTHENNMLRTWVIPLLVCPSAARKINLPYCWD